MPSLDDFLSRWNCLTCLGRLVDNAVRHSTVNFVLTLTGMADRFFEASAIVLEQHEGNLVP
jgi:hypothetical protein